MIDWDFIGQLEGYLLKGYVPNPETSNSGVTVGSGVDLGQMQASQLTSLPPDLQALLTPYLGLKKQAAVAALAAQPLTITAAQADALDALARGGALTFIQRLYDRATAAGAFDALPNQAQTVIASVSFQYGNLALRCPKFWGICVAQNWAGAVHELQNFGDAYSMRRNREAAYLAALIQTGE
jgi:hypothetical protein